jgi:hypothetical protein
MPFDSHSSPRVDRLDGNKTRIYNRCPLHLSPDCHAANECRSAVLFSSLFFGMKWLYFNNLILIPRRLARAGAEIDAATDGTAAIQSVF